MHPLLSPNTHADLKLLAGQLAQSGYYVGDDAYLKMFFGVTLGLTVLESLKAISIEEGEVIVEHFKIVERAAKRADYTVTVYVTDTSCETTVKYNGRQVGKAEYPADKNAAGRSYRTAYVKACLEFIPDVFGHKFYLREDMPGKAEALADSVSKATGLAVTTADTAPAPKPKPAEVDTHSEAYMASLPASNRNALLTWQNEIDQLNPNQPGLWDAHRFKLGEMKFLKEGELIDLLERFVAHAKSKGVGYKESDRRFFVMANKPQPA